MRANAATFAPNFKQLAAALMLLAAAGSSFATELAAVEQTSQIAAPQMTKSLSKSQATRQEILAKVARHEPLTYVEKLYLR